MILPNLIRSHSHLTSNYPTVKNTTILSLVSLWRWLWQLFCCTTHVWTLLSFIYEMTLSLKNLFNMYTSVQMIYSATKSAWSLELVSQCTQISKINNQSFWKKSDMAEWRHFTLNGDMLMVEDITWIRLKFLWRNVVRTAIMKMLRMDSLRYVHHNKKTLVGLKIGFTVSIQAQLSMEITILKEEEYFLLSGFAAIQAKE